MSLINASTALFLLLGTPSGQKRKSFQKLIKNKFHQVKQVFITRMCDAKCKKMFYKDLEY